MEQGKIVRELLEFHRKCCENNVKTVDVLFEQTEKMLSLFLAEVPTIPEEGQMAIKEWIAQCREGRLEFSRIVNEGYKKIEEALFP